MPSDDAVPVGSNLICAAIHHFGGAEVGRPGLRPYLGISAENERDLADVIEDYIEGVFKRGK